MKGFPRRGSDPAGLDGESVGAAASMKGFPRRGSDRVEEGVCGRVGVPQ